jgi:hypothetical protein
VPEKEGLIHFNASVKEFYNPDLPKIICLDNNIFAYQRWDDIFSELMSLNKPVQFKQGMDIRLLDKAKVEALRLLHYDRPYTFAFDHISELNIIDRQLHSYRHYFPDWSLRFFVLVGFDSSISDDLYRIEYLRHWKCLPYIMRHENYLKSEYKNFYIDLAAWVNQPSFFKNWSFEKFLNKRSKNLKRIAESLAIFKLNYPLNLDKSQ